MSLPTDETNSVSLLIFIQIKLRYFYAFKIKLNICKIKLNYYFSISNPFSAIFWMGDRLGTPRDVGIF